ncbi:MAG: D-alanyl-D-alanine carboxypeptidase family protein [Limnohabitans sp.]
MKHAFLIGLLSLCPVISVLAQTPQPPEIAARSYLLLDVSASQVLAEKAADTPVEPASLTKLMTAYLVFDALRQKKITLQQTFSVSPKAWKMEGSRMFIDPKMQVPVEDLIKGMIVQSGNDATMALAEGIAGTSDHFVGMMNAQTKALGMHNTQFKNPEGLPQTGHLTTARDLAVLATRLIHDFPGDVGYYAVKKYRYPGTPMANDSNRNLLLFRDPTVDGLKTGHTDAAGYCLVATAKRDFPNLKGRRLLAIVLGAASENARAEEAQKLLNWGYTAFDGIKLFDAGQAVVTPAVFKGRQAQVGLGSLQAIVVAVPQGQASKIKTLVTRPEPMLAPFQKNQSVASLKVFLDQTPLTDIPLVTLSGVEQAGFIGRTWDSLTLWLR